MKSKIIFFSFVLLVLVFSLIGCSMNSSEDKSIDIKNTEQAAEGSENVVDGLDEVTNDLDEIEDIVK